MYPNEKDQLIRKLCTLLDTDSDIDAQIELFNLLGQQRGIKDLVFALETADSPHIIRRMSFLLAYVEVYKDEISALYQWINALSGRLDNQSTGNLATAVQRHVAITLVGLPIALDIQQIMVPFLLQCLTARDWTIRDSAVSSLDRLEGLQPLTAWFTTEQLSKLKRNLEIHLQLAEEQEQSPPELGRLKRYVCRRRLTSR